MQSPNSHFKARKPGFRGGVFHPKSTQQNDWAGIPAEVCLMSKSQASQGYLASSSSVSRVGDRARDVGRDSEAYPGSTQSTDKYCTESVGNERTGHVRFSQRIHFSQNFLPDSSPPASTMAVIPKDYQSSKEIAVWLTEQRPRARASLPRETSP